MRRASCPAPVSGMDLHAPMDMSRTHTTWMELEDSLLLAPLRVQLDAAVKQNRTIVSNGPVLLYERKGDLLSLQTDLKTDKRSRECRRRLLSFSVCALPRLLISEGFRDTPISPFRLRDRKQRTHRLKLYPGYARPEETERLLPSCIRACLPQAQSIPVNIHGCLLGDLHGHISPLPVCGQLQHGKHKPVLRGSLQDLPVREEGKITRSRVFRWSIPALPRPACRSRPRRRWAFRKG